MSHWAQDATFYHIYPLGFCGAPVANDFTSKPVPRLNKVLDWINHLKQLGTNAIYFGPLFESTSHGYDTADYFNLDRRLGTNADLMRVIANLHENGIKVVLDGVFNHVGRDFWAFKDVRQNLANSRYGAWFSGVNFARKSPFQDSFTYDGWNGHFNLVRLNLKHLDVNNHLFGAIKQWIEAFNIDGLRLDCADCLDLGFITKLSKFCKSLRQDFWLLGEVIHGDYNKWVNAGLDSVTNYECYKGLYSSHNDKNYFEIAASFNRQFGDYGLYRRFLPFSFADNHDVNRVASMLKNKSHLFPLYILLFTMPGIPSIYYGSEWGIEGRKINGNDWPLRPNLELRDVDSRPKVSGLELVISQLSGIRQYLRALKVGGYHSLHVNHQQFAFSREIGDEKVMVVVNSANQPIDLNLPISANKSSRMVDLLNGGEIFTITSGKINMQISPNWGRILTYK